jgi:hypothetical protein
MDIGAIMLIYNAIIFREILSELNDAYGNSLNFLRRLIAIISSAGYDNGDIKVMK